MNIYESPSSINLHGILSRPIWLSTLLLGFGFVLLSLIGMIMFFHIKKGLDLQSTLILEGVFILLLLSMVGLWKLRMWGIQLGTLALLLYVLGCVYAGTQFGYYSTFVFIVYSILYLWLKSQQRKLGASSYPNK